MQKNNPVPCQKIPLPFKVKKSVLGLGSQTKNTVCFAQGNLAFISQVHQDLSSPAELSAFEKDAAYFLKKKPRVVVHDLHPEYQSTKFADTLRAKSYELQAVQHHHAHIAACMAENGLKNQKVIGVAFDGTGLGSDDTLWGAEFLVCDYKSFSRRAHLREIPLLGGERAILEPWRVAAAWLYPIYKEKLFDLNIPFSRGVDRKKWKVLKSVLVNNVNAPLASSMGRLFDAAASLILVRHSANKEAELAIALEKIASTYSGNSSPYGFSIRNAQGSAILDPSLMFHQIISDLKAKKPQQKIAYKFHLTIAEMVRKICLKLGKENRIKTVVLSGGVFQNKLLLRMCTDFLQKEDFLVVTHAKLPSNDACISLGQCAVANFRS